MKTLTGIVRGRTIELTETPEIPEGQHVVVQLTIVNGGHPRSDRPRGGSMGADWTDDDDRILAQIERERKMADARTVPE